MRTFLAILFIIILSDCSPVRKYRYGMTIKGDASVVARINDKELNGKSLLTGYVYSRFDSTFLSSASINLSNGKGTTTDSKGYFSYYIEPGKYDVTSQYLGHINQTIKNLSIKEGEHIIIVFELGTEKIY